MTTHGIASPATTPNTDPAKASAGSASTENAPPEAVAAVMAGPAGAGLLAVLALLWLVATVWAAHASIAGDTVDAAAAVSSAALALPGVIAASLLAGAATGLAAVCRFSWGSTGSVRRVLTGSAAAAVPGVACAAVTVLRYGTTSSVAVLAITVGVASILAGAATVLPTPTLTAGVGATLGVFVVGALVNFFQTPLKSMFGAAETVRSQFDAAKSLSLAAAVVSGVVAGVVAYLVLRRRPAALPWPAYLMAGLVPGLFLLLAEGLTLVGGASLLDLVGALSPADLAVVTYVDSTRVSHALVVTFVGAIAAMIAIGRTLRRPEEPTEEPPAQEAPAPGSRA